MIAVPHPLSAGKRTLVPSEAKPFILPEREQAPVLKPVPAVVDAYMELFVWRAKHLDVTEIPRHRIGTGVQGVHRPIKQHTVPLSAGTG